MAWQDRLRTAAYTPPSGVRLFFSYEEVGEAFDRKSAAFTFADADGTYIQDLGTTGRRYPLRIILHGNDYDILAAGWMAALSERGPGVLEHPVHGRKVVVPTGTVKRRDDLVNQSNQAIIEVEFFETLGTAYPQNTAEAKSTGAAQLNAAAAAQAEQFASAAALGTATQRANFLTDFNQALDTVREALTPLADTIDTVKRQFDAIDQSINRGINILINDPLTMAYQVQQLIRTPARILASGTARLEAYADLADQLVSGTPSTRSGLDSGDLINTAVYSAMVETSNNTEFLRRNNALSAAELIMAKADALAAWRDQAYAGQSLIDNGGAWQETQRAAATVAGRLVGSSFDLIPERYFTLDSHRSIIDVVFELYGTVDNKLDDFINDNDLTGDLILELPRGAEVVYYAN